MNAATETTTRRTPTPPPHPNSARVGDKLVVPACDVGEVVAIETLTFEGQSAEFYRIELAQGASSWVPLGGLIPQGIRKVMSKERAAEVLEIIGQQTAPAKRANWNQRRRRYQEMLLGNAPAEVAALLGELGAVRTAKGRLSFSERQLFDKVLGLLASELALVLGVDQTTAEGQLEFALAK